jgi:hypothetical protein
MPSDPLAEETTDPIYADDRNFFKVEQWDSKDSHVVRLHYAGNRIDRAREVFAAFARKRPAARLTIRQRARVLEKWPRE